MPSTRRLAGALAALALVAGWRRFRPFPVRVSGESMLPALRPGDLLAVSARLDPAPGDVVVVRDRGREIVKRVAAIAGEGLVVAGDNRNASADAVVTRDAVEGVVLARYWPRPRIVRGLSGVGDGARAQKVRRSLFRRLD